MRREGCSYSEHGGLLEILTSVFKRLAVGARANRRGGELRKTGMDSSLWIHFSHA